MKTSFRAKSLAPDAQGQFFGRTCLRIGYWVSTGVVALLMASSGLTYLRYAPQALEGLFALSYFSFVGVFQLLGSIVLLAPGWPRLKPWVYAISALHFNREIFIALASGETREAVAFFIVLGLLAISFLLRPAMERR
jgi:hypothetical protein